VNTVIVTGYLNSDAEERFTPRGERKYTFDVVVAVPGGHVPYSCVLEEPSLTEKVWTLLTAGRACILRCELSGAPVMEHGRLKYWSRFLRVVDAEFPNRGGAKKDEAKPEAPAEAAKA
jgi:hypothetical protein